MNPIRLAQACLCLILVAGISDIWAEIPATTLRERIAPSLPDPEEIDGGLVSGMDTEEDGRIRVASVVGTIHADPSAVYRVLTDYAHYVEFLPYFTKCVVLDPAVVEILRSGEMPKVSHVMAYASSSSQHSDSSLLLTEMTVAWGLGKVRSIVVITADSARREIYWRQMTGRLTVWEGVWRWKPCEQATVVFFASRFYMRTWLPAALIQNEVSRLLPIIMAGLQNRLSHDKAAGMASTNNDSQH